MAREQFFGLCVFNFQVSDLCNELNSAVDDIYFPDTLDVAALWNPKVKYYIELSCC
jgi:hypothetical protein